MTGYLLDENLPAEALAEVTLPVFHATDLGWRCSDDQLWEFARARDLVIVKQDFDFSGRMLRSTPPPQVVHLRTGNLRRASMIRLLRQSWPQVGQMLAKHKLVYLYPDRLEGVPSK
jgi:predicted nuclease of predicted toxin-antitoxin system